MTRLVQLAAHDPVDPGVMVPLLQEGAETWLGARMVGGGIGVVALVPAGLLPREHEALAVTVRIGPFEVAGDAVVRRLAFEVIDLVPQTRCDLTATPAGGNGTWLRLAGEFRTSDPHDLRQVEAVESIALPLLHQVFRRASVVGSRA